ncbi:MMPL family transporter [Rheinheimera baltica]|uniref:efflux RND transporter permease subunit n=1 Tax=Rheinheimera baltica TaxID=67576 RepID=UPI00273CF9BD|nr:MMPL family transporter [Rheinheimera baltica]MDP5142417.1 MMPL family transporter [Rheinheimera baltica]
MKQLWLTSVLNTPWRVLFGSLLLTLLMGAGISKLEFRGDYRIFFSADNPQLLAFEQMQNAFNKSDNILIGIAPADGNVFSAETLSLILQLTDAAWQTPHSIRVDSLTNYQLTEADEDDLMVGDLVPQSMPLAPQALARIRQIALNEPSIVKRLVADTGKVAAINITVQFPEVDKNREVFDTYNFVKQLTDEFSRQYPQVQFHLGGVIAMNNALASEAEQDARTLIPLMFSMIIIMLALLLRSIVGALATIIIIVIAIVSTLGLAGWAGIFLSMTTVNVPTILMTLAVADCVHVIASMQFALQRGDNKANAIRYSMQRNIMPVFITSSTTAIGFLTLNFSEVPILADLGNMSATGVMLACGFSLITLPALLYLLPLKASLVPKPESSTVMDRLAGFVIRRHNLLLPIMLLIMLAFTGFISLNKINDEAVKYFSPNTQFRQSMDFLDQHLSASASIDFALNSGQSSGINQPEFIAAVDSFSQWLAQQPEVVHVNAISDTFKRLNKNMHGDDPAYYRIPTASDEAAQYLLMYEMSLPYGLDLNNQLNLDKSATRIAVSLQNMGSKQITEFERKALSYLTQHYPQYSASAASTALMFGHIGERNMASMLQTLPLALLLISLLLALSLRSWRMGLISLVPNIAPAAIGFGIWGWYSGEINLGLSVVASLSLGIIVDDTVHFLAKYQHARQEGRNTEAAVRYAFTSVGRALWITTAVLIVGFSVLMLSNFRLNSDMGLLTAIIIFTALVIDFLFLPAFLLKFDTKESKRHA